MNIFESLKSYAGKWSVVNSRNFTQDEINAVSSAVVVSSEYGNSVCFHMVSGGMTFIPLSNNSTKGIGESVDLNQCKLLTLSKQGEADINRIEC